MKIRSGISKSLVEGYLTHLIQFNLLSQIIMAHHTENEVTDSKDEN